jgi:hypothetical protein
MHGRASRRIAFDVGVEEGYGSDPGGYQHYDFGFALPEMYFYLTPDSVVQAYTLAGMNLRLAHYEAVSDGANPYSVPWMNGFLGVVIGGGAEVRLNDKTAVRFEIRGFLRGRIDAAHESDELHAVNDTIRGVSLGVGLVYF